MKKRRPSLGLFKMIRLKIRESVAKMCVNIGESGFAMEGVQPHDVEIQSPMSPQMSLIDRFGIPTSKNLGGGYVGVGSDQSYDFMASQRASWGWAFDYDPNVYRLHRMMNPLILASETPEQLVAYFAPDRLSKSRPCSSITMRKMRP